jgi:hypothetical protein
MNSYHEGVSEDFFDFAGPSADLLEQKLQDVFVTFASSGEIDSPALVNMLREGCLLTQQFTAGSVHIAFMKARQVARHTPRWDVMMCWTFQLDIVQLNMRLCIVVYLSYSIFGCYATCIVM